MVDYARDNGLLLLFGPEEQARFQELYPRMPAHLVKQWRELLSGGRSSEAFGPLDIAERLDERKIERDLKRGRARRLVLVGVGLVGVAALVGAVGWWLSSRSDDDQVAGSIQFTDVAESDEAPDRSGPPPEVDPRLVTDLDVPVVVRAGDAPRAERIVYEPAAGLLPIRPGSVRAAVFQYAGRGQLVLVGPPGWHDDTCVVASVTSRLLRPFDVVRLGDCGDDAPGRPALAECVSPTVVMLDLEVPPGPVALVEGGEARPEVVRAQVLAPDPDYETLSVRGDIAVGEQDVVVPRFGAEVGTRVDFDLGDGVEGSCTISPAPTEGA